MTDMEASCQGQIQCTILTFTQKEKGKPQVSQSHNGLVQSRSKLGT